MTDESIGGHPYVACRNCGWVSYALTREEAEAAVNEFNSHFDAMPPETQAMYGDRRSSLEDYRCHRCGKDHFQRVSLGDSLRGSTISPVVWDMTPEFLDHLRLNAYDVIHRIPGFRWVALFKFIFTTAIIVGDLDDTTGYSDRWCYHDKESALAGLAEWSGRGYEGEPTGWHRHPATGRRAGPDHEFNEALKEL